MNDHAKAGDGATAGLAEYVPPRHPCPACGKESAPSQVPGVRVCRAKRCRFHFPEA